MLQRLFRTFATSLLLFVLINTGHAGSLSATQAGAAQPPSVYS
jgi:hypothetical protein